MATINRTREGTRNQKRMVSVGTAHISPADITADLDLIELFSIPEDALIINTEVTMREAFDPGTSLTIELFYNAAQIKAPVDITLLGISSDVSTKRQSLTGGLVTMSLALVGAVPTVGIAEVMVEYIEYEKTNGELTNFSTSP